MTISVNLEHILSLLPDAVLLLNPQLAVVYLNAQAERMTAHSRETSLEKPLALFFPQAKNLLAKMEESLLYGRHVIIREEELENLSHEKWTVEIHLTPLQDTEGKISHLNLILRDLSVFKKMEEELRQADRQALMGTIASGLAHEIKNPLGGIKGAAQMLVRETKNLEHREYLQIIIKEAERVNGLISELLNFSRPQKIQLKKINLNQLLDEVLELESKTEDQKHIKFVRDYDPSLPKIEGDEDQLKSVFLNLIRNAREAIEKKGTIQLKTKLFTDYQLKNEKGRAIRLIEVAVQDNGCGMSHEVLAKLFSPFFSSKKRGSGLGLAICHRILNEHQGFIQVESKIKQGSTFKVFLRTRS